MARRVNYDLLRRRESCSERLSYALRLIETTGSHAAGLHSGTYASFAGNPLGDRLARDAQYSVDELHHAANVLAEAIAAVNRIDVTEEVDDDEDEA